MILSIILAMAFYVASNLISGRFEFIPFIPSNLLSGLPRFMLSSPPAGTIPRVTPSSIISPMHILLAATCPPSPITPPSPIISAATRCSVLPSSVSLPWPIVSLYPLATGIYLLLIGLLFSIIFAITLLFHKNFCLSTESLNAFELPVLPSLQVEVIPSTELVYLPSILSMPCGYSAGSRLMTIIPSTPKQILLNDENGRIWTSPYWNPQFFAPCVLSTGTSTLDRHAPRLFNFQTTPLPLLLEPPPPQVSSIEEISASIIEERHEAVDTNGVSPLSRLISCLNNKNENEMTRHQVPNFYIFPHSQLEGLPTPDHRSTNLPSATTLKTSPSSYASKIPRLITPFDAEKYKPSYARQTRSTALKRKGYTYRPPPKRLALHSKLPLSQEARIHLQGPPRLKSVWRHKPQWYI